ncbi:MAG: SRPBCC domain-containing protein [Saprospiraceae bacterium]
MQFTIQVEIAASREEIFKAWLDSAQHSDMTGSHATAGNQIGDSFTSFDDYAWGTNVELRLNEKIGQSWRTTEFADNEPDSLLEITLLDSGENTLLTIHHSNLPDHGMTYRQGWIDYYFEPMKAYFTRDVI